MKPQRPRILFAGTPEFAAASLRALLAHPAADVVGVYTQPDRPAGRGRQLLPSPVKALALQHALPVWQPLSLKDPEEQQRLAALGADLMVVAAYGLILPRAVLWAPRLGCLNVHASVLPRWRGAAPIERAIEAGDTRSGITLMQMDEGLDTGPVLRVRECGIAPDDTGGSLRERLAALGAEVLGEALPAILAGSLQGTAQDPQHATYAAKLRREEALLDWSVDATTLARRVRAFNPANVCHTRLDGEALKIWFARAEPCLEPAAPGTVLAANREGILVACGAGALRLTELQLPGGRAMTASALLNGRPGLLQPGTRLG
jgi:methionyl-tRNA formyltransferase